jgi:hypothetical protein
MAPGSDDRSPISAGVEFAARRAASLELMCALVLSLATVGSAWCAYQSTLWGGVQTFRLVAASDAGRKSSEKSIAALETRVFDASLMTKYIEAELRGEREFARAIRERIRPNLRAALEAWLATDPFKNADAPQSPLSMREYIQPEVMEAARFAAEQERMLGLANSANGISDRYVLLTVLYASVMFFGGISGTLRSRRTRGLMMGMALVLFGIVMLFLIYMPICRE